MNVENLRKLCEEGPSVILIIPKPGAYRWGPRVRLAGRFGPLGHVLCVKETDVGINVVASFSSRKILDCLERFEGEARS